MNGVSELHMNEYFFLETWSDGGARGNPGPAGIGVVVKDAQGREVRALGRYIGATTNNIAEYAALIEALKICRELGSRKVRLHLDSELVVRQLTGHYKVKNEGLKPLFLEATGLLKGLEAEILHVRREHNKEADALVNQAIDAAGTSEEDLGGTVSELEEPKSVVVREPTSVSDQDEGPAVDPDQGTLF